MRKWNASFTLVAFRPSGKLLLFYGRVRGFENTRRYLYRCRRTSSSWKCKAIETTVLIECLGYTGLATYFSVYFTQNVSRMKRVIRTCNQIHKLDFVTEHCLNLGVTFIVIADCNIFCMLGLTVLLLSIIHNTRRAHQNSLQTFRFNIRKIKSGELVSSFSLCYSLPVSLFVSCGSCRTFHRDIQQ